MIGQQVENEDVAELTETFYSCEGKSELDALCLQYHGHLVPSLHIQAFKCLTDEQKKEASKQHITPVSADPSNISLELLKKAINAQCLRQISSTSSSCQLGYYLRTLTLNAEGYQGENIEFCENLEFPVLENLNIEGFRTLFLRDGSFPVLKCLFIERSCIECITISAPSLTELYSEKNYFKQKPSEISEWLSMHPKLFSIKIIGTDFKPSTFLPFYFLSPSLVELQLENTNLQIIVLMYAPKLEKIMLLQDMITTFLVLNNLETCRNLEWCNVDKIIQSYENYGKDSNLYTRKHDRIPTYTVHSLKSSLVYHHYLMDFQRERKTTEDLIEEEVEDTMDDEGGVGDAEHFNTWEFGVTSNMSSSGFRGNLFTNKRCARYIYLNFLWGDEFIAYDSGVMDISSDELQDEDEGTIDSLHWIHDRLKRHEELRANRGDGSEFDSDEVDEDGDDFEYFDYSDYSDYSDYADDYDHDYDYDDYDDDDDDDNDDE